MTPVVNNALPVTSVDDLEPLLVVHAGIGVVDARIDFFSLIQKWNRVGCGILDTANSTRLPGGLYCLCPYRHCCLKS